MEKHLWREYLNARCHETGKVTIDLLMQHGNNTLFPVITYY